MQHFPRKALAQAVTTSLQGKTLLGDAPNGLFLAAPRRTGKTTFLQMDLRPALELAGVVVVYVDLWAHDDQDPGILIAKAIAHELRKHLGIVARTAQSAGLQKVKVGGLEMDIAKIGQVEGLTLSEALQLLIETSEKPVALIIDEAQQALTSTAGATAMKALKSARDQINRPGRVQLMLVMSGSDRDKLMLLVNSSAAPFFGSQVQSLPLLGMDFVDHLATAIEAQRADLAPVDRALLLTALEGFGFRPQLFTAALERALAPFANPSNDRFETVALAASTAHQAQEEAQLRADFLGLQGIERVVLWRMLEKGQYFRPYDADAMAFYASKLGGNSVQKTQVQQAMGALRDHTPALIWRDAKGGYAVQDLAMHRWFEALSKAAQWPPIENK